MASDSAAVTRVTVNRPGIAFPKICCCCGQPSDQEVPLSATKRMSLRLGKIHRILSIAVPCCVVCGPRVAWEHHGGGYGLIPKAILSLGGSLLLGWALVVCLIMTFVLALLVDLLFFLGLPAQAGPWLPWAVGVALWLWWLRREVRKRPRGIVGPEHVCTKGAVYIGGFDAQSVTLGFLREQIAFEFVKANSERGARVEASTLGQ